MSAILNSAILLVSHFEQKKNFTHSFWLNLMMAAIFNSTILDSAILHKKLHSFILTHLDDGSHLEFCHLGFSHFEQKKHLVSHSFRLNLIMAAILKSTMLNLAILLSDILVLPLKLTHTCQDWFPAILHKKNFTHSFWLNFILNSAILDSATKKKTSVIHSDSTWWWQPSWNLPCWIQTLPSLIDTLLSSLRFTQKHSHSTLTLTQTNSI